MLEQVPQWCGCFCIKKEGVSASSSISADGDYNITGAPLGDCTITVVVNQLLMDPTAKSRLSGKGAGPKMPDGPRMPGAEYPRHVCGQYAQEDCSHR